MNGVVPAHHRASRRLLPRPPYAVTNPSLKVAMVLVHPNCHVAGHFCPPRAMVRSLAPSRAWARSEPAPTKSVGLTTFSDGQRVLDTLSREVQEPVTLA